MHRLCPAPGFHGGPPQTRHARGAFPTLHKRRARSYSRVNLDMVASVKISWQRSAVRQSRRGLPCNVRLLVSSELASQTSDFRTYLLLTLHAWSFGARGEGQRHLRSNVLDRSLTARQTGCALRLCNLDCCQHLLNDRPRKRGGFFRHPSRFRFAG